MQRGESRVEFCITSAVHVQVGTTFQCQVRIMTIDVLYYPYAFIWLRQVRIRKNMRARIVGEGKSTSHRKSGSTQICTALHALDYNEAETTNGLPNPITFLMYIMEPCLLDT